MMDMEMNAEMERDGGSDTGEASYEGSSAGSVYCTLERDFARITAEMRSNEALAAYEAEYARLFENLYKAQRLEEDLTGRCKTLKEEVSEGAEKILELEQRLEKDARSIEQLGREIEAGKMLADAAHAREQKAQEVIENLRVSIAKLTEELQLKNKQLSNDDATIAPTQQQEGAAKEKERLMGEIDALRQRLATVTSHHREVDEKLTLADQQALLLQDKIDKLNNELARERREREKTESEFQVLQEELKLRLSDLQTVEDTLKNTSSNAAKQEGLLREQVLENEKNQREIQRLMLKQMSLKTETEKLTERNEKIRKDLYDKNKYIKEIAREIARMREEIGKLRTEKENVVKKLMKERTLSARADENAKRLSASLRSARTEASELKQRLDAERKSAEGLSREREAAAKRITGLEDTAKRLNLEIHVLAQTNRKLESSLEAMGSEIGELGRQLKGAEKERDRSIVENQELAQQIENYMDELKLKRLEISDYQKRIAEGEAKLRQQQTLFEDVRAERNTYKKNLSIANEEIGKLKDKLKTLSLQADQLRDQLLAKEAALLKQEFLFGKMEKEKDALQTELENCTQTISNLCQELNEMRQAEKRLRQRLQEAETSIAKQKKEIESVMNERDVIGTQIVRRNDELSLQYSKLQILQETLNRGEKQYAQRLEDIRMLKLEVKKLRIDKEALERNTANLSDLRGEVFCLERNLTKERLKVMALEEEVQNPLNVHRWRNLEGTDPEAFDLLQKIQFLQKRILKMSSEMITKDKKIKETEKLYMNLREIIVKQPGPEVLQCLNKTRRALRDRGKKMKCLVAELNMTLSTEHKFETEKMKKELSAMKAKYLAQKKKNLKAIEQAKENLPTLSIKPPNKCYGGGFHLTQPSKPESTPLITINK